MKARFSEQQKNQRKLYAYKQFSDTQRNRMVIKEKQTKILAVQDGAQVCLEENRQQDDDPVG